ncbi:MFS transporter, variant 2 [Balamuthia mandrillaris]
MSEEDTPWKDRRSLQTGLLSDGDDSVHEPIRKANEIRTNIPARMDRLPWAPWHWLVCIALGISWILDGIQVTSLGIIGDTLKEEDTLHISSKQVGLLGTIYILGAVTGALFFGIISDKYGRKRLFIITPAVYLTATFASAFSWNFESFASFIFFVGLGIGGEYSAMNSAINEFIPARVRGIVDLAINGSYWFGAAIGAAASILFLDRDIFPANIGWRLPAGIGSVLGIIIILTRMFLPESPRWLMTHNRLEEAEAIVSGIESKIERQKGIVLDVPRNTITINTSSKALNIFRVLHEIFRNYWSRAILSLALMVSQAFFYNAIFFTYALILTDFYGVASSHIGYYLIPFALGNFLGAVTIGRLFDTIGRKPMIFFTYTMSATLLIGTGVLFKFEYLTAFSQTVCWSIIFFFSSAGASSAYLTISEVFPLEVRAIAIAVFYSLGTAGGGLLGPVLFGALIASEDRTQLLWGYVLGSALMYFAAIIVIFFGVNAEGKSLEEIAAPITRGAAKVEEVDEFDEEVLVEN